MPPQIDLTLPKTNSGEINHILRHSRGLNPAVLYLHVKLTDDAVTQLLLECNSNLEGGTDAVVLAPQHDFAGQPLQASYEYHIKEIVPNDQYDKPNYIAVVDENWKKEGVIEVTLIHGMDETAETDNSSELQCIIDTMRCPANQTGLQIVNLQIANVSWSEYKEQYD